MLSALLHAVRQKRATDPTNFPHLPEHARNLPRLTAEPCLGESCGWCAGLCPTGAIALGGGAISLDRGLCIGCRACVEACPTGAIAPDYSTRTAVRRREDLVLVQPRGAPAEVPGPPAETPFCRSVDVRVVSTGCNATDLEVAATTNPIFDCSRFGIHFVPSPRFADALLVTGPVGKAMHEPLMRCYEAMAEPRIVVAVGTCAISGGVHRGGYAEADGVTEFLAPTAFVPGCPPHPWSIIHGILTAADSPFA